MLTFDEHRKFSFILSPQEIINNSVYLNVNLLEDDKFLDIIKNLRKDFGNPDGNIYLYYEGDEFVVTEYNDFAGFIHKSSFQYFERLHISFVNLFVQYIIPKGLQNSHGFIVTFKNNKDKIFFEMSKGYGNL